MTRLAIAFARDLASRPWLTAANLGVLALGAMVVCSVDHAIVATRAAFGASWDALHGDTSHWLAMPGDRPFDERLYVEALHRLWADADLRRRITRMTPVVEGQVVAPDGVPIRLLGIDPLTLASGGADARRGGIRHLAGGGFGALLAAPGAVIMPAPLAEELGLEQGDAFSVTVPGRRDAARLLLAGRSNSRARVLLADIATAQEVLQPDLAAGGRLSRIELVVRGSRAPWPRRYADHLFPGLGAAARPQSPDLRRLAVGGLEVISADEARLASQRLADAFFFNLGALSLLALVVGVFLVVQSTTFNVRRRRAMLARFRALGVTPIELRAALVVEAMALGAAAAAIGCLMGVLLSGALVNRIAATVSDLFLRGALSELRADWLLIGKAGLLCVAGAGLAGWLAGGGEMAPARLMAPGIEPLRASGRLARLALVAGLVSGALGLALTDTGAWGALLTIAAVLLACALLMTDVLDTLLRGLRRAVAPLGVGIAWIVGDVQRHLLAASSAARALLVAVAASVGMIVMISSFRISFVTWLETRVAADLYLLAPLDASFSNADRRWAGGLPGVTRVTLRGSERTMIAGRRVELVWGEYRQGDLARYGPPPGFDPTRDVLLSEPLARAWKLDAGDPLPLHHTTFRVAGVFREYGGQGDVLVLDRDTHDLLYAPSGLGDTHDLRQPAGLEDTHDLRQPAGLGDTHHLRQPSRDPVVVGDTHGLTRGADEDTHRLPMDENAHRHEETHHLPLIDDVTLEKACGLAASGGGSTACGDAGSVPSLMRTMALWVDPERGSIDAVRRSIVGRFPSGELRSGDEIRLLALRVFDRTFVVADVLRTLALLVAVLGMLIAFATLQLARRYEMGVARAIGTSRTELVAAAIAEAAMLGVVVTLAALPVGTLVAWLLVDLLNARAFGWTFELHLPLYTLGVTAALAVLGATLAGLAPALEIVRRRPVDDLRMVDV